MILQNLNDQGGREALRPPRVNSFQLLRDRLSSNTTGLIFVYYYDLKFGRMEGMREYYTNDENATSCTAALGVTGTVSTASTAPHHSDPQSSKL